MPELYYGGRPGSLCEFDKPSGYVTQPFEVPAGWYSMFAWGVLDGASVVFECAPTKQGPWFTTDTFSAPSYIAKSDIFGPFYGRWRVVGGTPATLASFALVGVTQ